HQSIFHSSLQGADPNGGSSQLRYASLAVDSWNTLNLIYSIAIFSLSTRRQTRAGRTGKRSPFRWRAWMEDRYRCCQYVSDKSELEIDERHCCFGVAQQFHAQQEQRTDGSVGPSRADCEFFKPGQLFFEQRQQEGDQGQVNLPPHQ